MKALFFLIHSSLAAIAAWQGYTMFYPASPAPVPPASAEHEPAGIKAKPSRPAHRTAGPKTSMEKAIIKRNLFKIDLEQTKATAAPARKQQPKKAVLPEKTELKLTLRGTVESKTPSGNWAIIEDPKTRRQDLYQTGAELPMGAKIKEISRNRIILTYNGKTQRLEVETKPSTFVPSTPQPFNQTAGPMHSPNKSKNNNKSGSSVLGGLKSRPYMKNGNSEGLLVYGIRPGSELLGMGLKNGDIIQTVNEEEIKNSQDLKTAAMALEQEQEIKITLSRRGQEMEIFYKGADE